MLFRLLGSISNFERSFTNDLIAHIHEMSSIRPLSSPTFVWSGPPWPIDSQFINPASVSLDIRAKARVACPDQ